MLTSKRDVQQIVVVELAAVHISQRIADLALAVAFIHPRVMERMCEGVDGVDHELNFWFLLVMHLSQRVVALA